MLHAHVTQHVFVAVMLYTKPSKVPNLGCQSMPGWKFGSQIYSPAKSICQQKSTFTQEFTGEEEHPPLRDVRLGLHSTNTVHRILLCHHDQIR